MPYARKNTLIWQTGMYYHIYNRGARQVTIFREPTNYLFTISKLKEYSQTKRISVIAYCLMPNHYHFLVRQDGDEPQAIYHSSFSTVIPKRITECTHTAARFLKDDFEPKPSR